MRTLRREVFMLFSTPHLFDDGSLSVDIMQIFSINCSLWEWITGFIRLCVFSHAVVICLWRFFGWILLSSRYLHWYMHRFGIWFICLCCTSRYIHHQIDLNGSWSKSENSIMQMITAETLDSQRERGIRDNSTTTFFEWDTRPPTEHPKCLCRIVGENRSQTANAGSCR